MVIDRLAERLNLEVRRTECRALIGQTFYDRERIELVKPQTFMNLSGESVSCLLADKPMRSIKKTLIIVDDLALPFGTMRLRRRGSDGGHNGLKSLTQCLRTEKYARLRLGILPDHPVSNTRKFVLERFSKDSMQDLEETILTACDAVESLIKDGIDRAMSQFNK
jgi:PTH1 family peptidyl-tRNA hydrolase